MHYKWDRRSEQEHKPTTFRTTSDLNAKTHASRKQNQCVQWRCLQCWKAWRCFANLAFGIFLCHFKMLNIFFFLFFSRRDIDGHQPIDVLVWHWFEAFLLNEIIPYKAGLRSANEKNLFIYFPFSNRHFLHCFEAGDPFVIKSFQSGNVLSCSFWFVIG